MERTIIPASAIIPTRNRAEVLLRTLRSVSDQTHCPAEIIVVDASPGSETQDALVHMPDGMNIIYVKAETTGAALQRNQGMGLADQKYILFMDDDILLHPGCLAKMWLAISSDDRVGGVNAMIVNQHYTTPGRISRFMFMILSGERRASYAGKIIGPAWNLLPEDDENLPEVVPCEWLNTTCTIYRGEALPVPPFDGHFKGYSLMEDVALSVTVGKKWKLLNARVARIYHDSQPGDHKADLRQLSEMELVNRHYIMTRVLGRTGIANNTKFLIFQLFQLVTGLAGHRSLNLLIKDLRGKLSGFWRTMS